MLLFIGLLAGEAGGVRPRSCLLLAIDRTAATGFFLGVDFAGCRVLDCGTLGSAAFAVVDHLEAELSFTVAAGLEGSGFLVAADVVAAVGFFATAAEGGRLTSFLAATVLGGCAAVVLPVEGAVVTLEAAVLAVAVVEGLTVDVTSLDVVVAGRDVVDAGRDVEGPVAGLVVVFEMAAPPAFVVVEVLGFGAVDAAALLAVAVVLGLATLTVSATGLFLGMPFTVVDLVLFVAVAAATEVVLAGPTGFLSGTLDWFLTMEEAAAPTGLLGTAPAADAFAAVAVCLTAATETLLEDLTSFAVRCEAVPGRGPDAPADLAGGCILVAAAFGLTLGSAATGLSLSFGAAMGAVSFAASSGCDGACSVMLSCDKEGSATAAASVGSGVSMVSPSGFIPSS